MKDKPATGTTPIPATSMNVRNAITGLRGRDLLSTLRHVGRHGLRHPLHTAKHLLELGGTLGRVMLGDTPSSRTRATAASATPPGARTRSTGAACRPTWPGRNDPPVGRGKLAVPR
jgi:polyhydroxyalkanoate synthase